MAITTEILNEVMKEGRKSLLESEAKTICRDYGIPVTDFRVAQDENTAVDYAGEIGYPVVLKIVSPEIIHKSDIGGVVIDLKDAKEVLNAYRQIMKNVKKHNPNAKTVGLLVQEMAPQSTEVIVGATKDPQFGPTLMFGLGGIFVEILKDVAFRIAPVTENEAREMITEVKAFPLLKGYRGKPPADIDAIVSILLNTSTLIMEHQAIKELDLNPVMVYEKGAKTVDARIILE